MKKQFLLLFVALLLATLSSWADTREVGTGKTYATIQAAIDASVTGDIINVYPGNYSETATDRYTVSLQGTAGPYQFGLYFPPTKPGITVRGVDAVGQPITDFSNVASAITTNATNSFGESGIFVNADDIIIQGLKILDNVAGNGNNKTIEIIGNNFTMKYCYIDIADGGSIYFNDWSFAGGISTQTKYNLTGNKFAKGCSVDISSGTGYTGAVSDRVISGNVFTGIGCTLPLTWAAISFNGIVPGVGWFTAPVGAATISGNTFADYSEYIIRTRGTVDATQFNWQNYWNNNTFEKAVITLSDELTFTPRSYSYTKSGYIFLSVCNIGGSIQKDITNVAQAGDVVLVGAGTYNENVNVNKSIKLYGANYAVNPNNASWAYNSSRTSESEISANNNNGIWITANDVEVKGFKISGIGNGSTAIGNTNTTVPFSNWAIENNWISGNTDAYPIYTNGTGGILFNTLSIVNNRLENNGGANKTGMNIWHANGVTISGNYIDGATYHGINSDGYGVGTITGNRILNCRFAAIQIPTSYSSDQNYTISNNSISGCQIGIRSYTGSTYPNIKLAILNNTIDVNVSKLDLNFGTIDLRGTNSGTSTPNTVSGNLITMSGTVASSAFGQFTTGPATAAYGIVLRGNLGFTEVKNNTIDGGSVVGASSSTTANPGPDMSGIYLRNQNANADPSATTLTGTFNILNNDIKGFKNAFVVYNTSLFAVDALPASASVVVNNNSLLPTSGGKSILAGTGGTQIEASCNWWGTNCPAEIFTKISGDVDYSPFLLGGDDAASTTIGYQPGAVCGDGLLAVTSVDGPVDPVALGTSINITVYYSSANSATPIINWGDESTTTEITVSSSTSGSFTISHIYTTPGVYLVSGTLGDGCQTATFEYRYVVVYDPSAGFVTGSGWIISPAGAYHANPTLTGTATFGFVSKYVKGKSLPTGNTEFQFHAAGMIFKSTVYEWLVVSGTKAQFKGSGTINGSGNYGFMLSAMDGTPDKFRIKIWDKVSGATVYDNQLTNTADNADPTTAIGGGSIVVHVLKTKSAEIATSVEDLIIGTTLKAWPNPFNERLNIEFSSATDTHARLVIYSITGAKLSTVFDNQIKANLLYRFEYIPSNLAAGILMYQLVIDEKVFNGKVVYKPIK